MINRVILVGRLTKNPEIRKTQNGASICKFTLVVSRKVKAQGNRMQISLVVLPGTKQQI